MEMTMSDEEYISQLETEIKRLEAENEKLRQIMTQEFVMTYAYAACGDHPAMFGYVTKADGEHVAAHQSPGKALDYFIEQALKEGE